MTTKIIVKQIERIQTVSNDTTGIVMIVVSVDIFLSFIDPVAYPGLVGTNLVAPILLLDVVVSECNISIKIINDITATALIHMKANIL